MNRSEAEVVVRSIRRTCRGLPVLASDVTGPLHQAWYDANGTGNWDAAFEVCRTAEAKVTEVAGLKVFGGAQVDVGDWEALWRRAAHAIFAYGEDVGKPCGADFNDVICAFPFDGTMHTLTDAEDGRGVCPKCGNLVPFTSPVFELEG